MSRMTTDREDRLDALRAEYADRLPARVAEIAAACARLREGEANAPALREIETLAGRLAGSAAGFGYMRATELARAIDFLARGIRHTTVAPTGGDLAQVAARVHALEQAARTPDGRPPALDDGVDGYTGRRSRGPRPHETRDVYILEGDEHLGEQLRVQLSYFGYQARVFTDADALEQAVRRLAPAALLLEVTLASGDLTTLDAVQPLRIAGRCPVLFMSTRRDLPARLAAVRAGGNEYLVKPIDLVELVDKLDRLTTRAPADPYRIMLVDANARRAEQRADAMRVAGMSVDVVSDPMWVMEPLVNFRPDVILIDVDLPKYGGIELAEAIRQQESHVGIPIVFCTSDARIVQRLAQCGFGGEPSLVEPFDPRLMIATVHSLAERSRILQSLMVRDALTGLFNQSRIKEQLAYEVHRARRDGTRLSYAMIDIDNFKAINDTYGHPTGDRVLKTLARLLQQRLRRTDFIGRYGGDEFAAILPGTGADEAKLLLEGIRAAFAQAREGWVSDETESGFSCGIADLGEHDAIELNRAADDALYEAKRAGRNRVLVAGAAAAAAG
ncbi:MAG TPA: diguanylate cyclase [Kofleriaceae bacterium]|nr:diguanylate cyclase [Kofleriaceae bacterium]